MKLPRRYLRKLSAVCVIIALLLMAYPARVLADSVRNHEWILDSLNMSKAHIYSEGKGVIVGVIDTGVDRTHPDLFGNVVTGVDFSNKAHPDGYSNGFKDVDGHGTSIAALIAGHGHGQGAQDGIEGVAPQAKVMPARDTAGLGADPVQLAKAINWAVVHGASVICIAEGSPAQSPAEDHSVAAAEAKDVVVVAAAGNSPAKAVEYPAAYPGVIAVAGTDESGKHSSFSVTGPQITLAAPARDIYSAWLDHAYVNEFGTSPAAAIVAGAAALVRSRFPKLSAVEVIHRLTATATDEGPPGRDDEYGYGELNIVAALTAKVPPLSASPSPTEIAKPRTTTTTTIATSSNTSRPPWLPIVAVLVAMIVGLAFWASARRRR